MARLGRAGQPAPRGGDEAIQHEGGLARPRRAGHRGQAVHRELSGEVMQVVKVGDLDGDPRAVSRTLGPVTGNAGRAGQEGADDRARVGFQLTGVPAAITWPPCAPAPGPSSITQSAERMSSRSCSTTITELPFPARAEIILRNPVTLLGCSPTDGSSSTYSMPVVLARTVEVSSIRCRSPVDSEAPGRSRVR